MAAAGFLGNTTFEYLGVSENGKARHVLEFFANYPELIVIEASLMANPCYVICRLSETLNVEGRDLRNRFAVGFLFWTGVRLNEFLTARRKDVDLITRTFNVPTLKQKRGRIVYRPIPLTHVPSMELKLWENYFEACGVKKGDRLLLVSDRQVERIVKKVLGEGFTPHSLRHGLGLWLYEYTKDIRVVAQVLRHTNISNTLIYTRLSLDAIRDKLKIW